MSDAPAEQVLDGRFQLLTPLGSGGMATVYRARDLTTGTEVAVKVLSREFLEQNPKEAERNVRRFQREAEILKLLDGHPNVVGYVAHGRAESGLWYIAMELLRGRQLRKLLGRDGKVLALPAFYGLSVQLLAGLIAIHGKGILHRDLAPDNIMVVPAGGGKARVKYLDFGIGKSLDGELDQVTKLVTIMGKPAYFSPEQARGIELTAKSDVYAMGVILYEMLTGRLPLDVGGVEDFIRIHREAPPHVTSFEEGRRVPAEVAGVIMRCLAKRPDERPKAEEVLAILRSVRRTGTGTAEAPTLDVEPEPEPAPPPAPAAVGAPEPRSGGTAGRRAGGDSPQPGAPSPPPRPAPGLPKTGATAPARGEMRSEVLTAGSRFGRYLIKEKLGSGGMGHVYLAWDEVLERDVALKLAVRMDPATEKEVLHEARMAAALSDPHIVTTYDTGSDSGVAWIAMEYVAGRTLQDLIASGGPLSGETFYRIADGVLAGVEAAHARKPPVIHRDIKPANVLVVPPHGAKITDFGIARAAAEKATKAAKAGHTGSIAGSAETMSPEQCLQKPADERSDIYSLGCTLYWMATGAPPFEGNFVSLLFKHAHEAPESPLRRRPTLQPKGLANVILRCLEKDPAKRYQSAGEIRADLRLQFPEYGTIAVPLYRNKAVLALAATLLVVLSVAAWFIARKPSTAVRPVFQRIGEHAVKSPDAPIWVSARQVPVSITGAGPGGRVKLVVAPEGGGAPLAETVVTANREGAVLHSLPLPVPDGATVARYRLAATAEGGDGRAVARAHLCYDTTAPTVTLVAYGREFAPGTPIRVLSYRHVAVVVADPESGVRFGRDDPVPRRDVEAPFDAFKSRGEGREKVLEADATSASGVSVTAEFPVECVEPEVTAPDAAGGEFHTRDGSVPVRLRLAIPRNAGLDDLKIADLDLPVEVMAEGGGGGWLMLERRSDVWEGTLPLPSSLAGRRTALSVRVAGIVAKRAALAVVHDTDPPCLWARGRSAEGASVEAASGDSAGAQQTFVMRASGAAQRSLADVVEVTATDAAPGALTGVVSVTLGAQAPVEVVIGENGRISLPENIPQESSFGVVITARDRAGHEARLPFTILRSGAGVSACRLGGRDIGPEPLHVAGATLSFEARLTDVRPEESLLVRIVRPPDDVKLSETPVTASDDVYRPVKDLDLELSEGEAIAMAERKVILVLRAGSDETALATQRILYDRLAPSVTAVAPEGDREVELPFEQIVTRFPRFEVAVTDGAYESLRGTVDSAQIRIDSKGPAIRRLEPRTSGDGSVRIAIAAEDPGAEGTYDFVFAATDRAGNAAPERRCRIRVARPRVALAEIDRIPVEEGDGEIVHATQGDAVEVVIANRGIGRYRILIKIAEEGGIRNHDEQRVIEPGRSQSVRVHLGGTGVRSRITILSSGEGEPDDRAEKAATFSVVRDLEPPRFTVLVAGTPQEPAGGEYAVPEGAEVSILVADDVGFQSESAVVVSPDCAKEGRPVDGELRTLVLKPDVRGAEPRTVSVVAIDRSRRESQGTFAFRTVSLNPVLASVDGRSWNGSARVDVGSRREVGFEARGGHNVSAVRVEIAREGLKAQPVDLPPDPSKAAAFAGKATLPAPADSESEWIAELYAVRDSRRDDTPFARVTIVHDSKAPAVRVERGGTALAPGTPVENLGRFEELVIAVDDASPPVALKAEARPSRGAAPIDLSPRLKPDAEGRRTALVDPESREATETGYTLSIVAADKAGNTSAPAEIEVRLAVWRVAEGIAREVAGLRPDVADAAVPAAARRLEEIRTSLESEAAAAARRDPAAGATLDRIRALTDLLRARTAEAGGRREEAHRLFGDVAAGGRAPADVRDAAEAGRKRTREPEVKPRTPLGRDSYPDPRTTITFRRIPPGGASGESKIFYMSETETTFEQFTAFEKVWRSDLEGDAEFKRRLSLHSYALKDPAAIETALRQFRSATQSSSGGADFPVFGVPYRLAWTFAAWAHARLPTKAEWQAAAGRAVKPDADFPVWRQDTDAGTLAAIEKGRGRWSVFSPTPNQPGSLMKVSSLEPGLFALRGMAGNLAEYAAGGMAVWEMGGAFNSGTDGMRIEPRQSGSIGKSAADCRHVGIRLALDPGDREGP